MAIYRNNQPLPDRILLKRRNEMHPAVAVANFLKILAIANPRRCLQDWGRFEGNALVRQGRMNEKRTSIKIDGIVYTVGLVNNLQGEQVEFCEEINNPDRQSYWILNPTDSFEENNRLVISCNRPPLAECVEAVNQYCVKNAQSIPQISGIVIR